MELVSGYFVENMTVSCIVLFAQEGKGMKILSVRNYRKEVKISEVRSFMDEALSVQRGQSVGDKPPLIVHNGITYIWKRAGGASNVYALAATKWDTNVLMVQELLHQLLEILRLFCPDSGVLSSALGPVSGPLRADNIREKAALVLSVLDEAVEFGYPQVTHEEGLSELIVEKPSSTGKIGALDALLRRRTEAGSDGSNQMGPSSTPTLDVTGAVPWRKAGIVYKKNEVYLDAIEKVSALVSQDGTMLSGNVQGNIQMRVYLSGMPECKIGLNDKLMMESESQSRYTPTYEGRPSTAAQKSGRSQVALDYIKFHQAVKLQAYESDHEVHFIPPDGEFELLSYDVSDNFTLPFRIISNYQQLGRTRAELNVKLRADFPSTLTAFQVIVWMPLPKSTVKVKMNATGGKTKSKYVELDKHQVRWKISELTGGKEHKFQANIEMMAGTELSNQQEREWEKPPLRLTFQVPMFTATGLRIRFLKVFEKSGYTPTKWVRYVTTGGDYEVRIG